MPTVTYELDWQGLYFLNSYIPGDQSAPDLLTVHDGDSTGFVVAYDNSAGFELLDFYTDNGAGAYVGLNTVEPFANSAATNALGASSLTQLANGNVVAVWDDDHPTTPGIVGAIFDTAGAVVRAEFNLTDDSWDKDPQVAALAGGGFAVTFHDRGSIYLEILNDAGAEVVTEFRVAERTTGFGPEPMLTTHSEPVIAALAEGGLVVVWTQNSDMTGRDVRASIYDADGSLRAGNIVIDAGEENSQPSVTALPDGGFAVAYASVEGSDNEIFARIFDADGDFVSEIDVSDPLNGNISNASDPSIAVLENGFIVVAWTNTDTGWTNTDTSSDVRFRVFDQNGAPFALDGFPGALVAPLPLNWTGPNASQSVVAGLASGRFVAAWQDSGLEDGDAGIAGSVGEITRTATGDGGDETITGDALRDVMLGLGGDDTLNGEGGDDVLDGGEHVDTLSGGFGDDVLAGGQGADSLHGGDGYDTASYEGASSGVAVDLGAVGTGGDGQGDVLVSIERVIGSDNEDQLRGDGDGDRLEGRGGDDDLRGGRGDDTLIGGDGGDTLYGDEGADVLHGGYGDDNLHGNAGDDELIGGSGHDWANYSTATSGVWVDLDFVGRGRGVAYIGDEVDQLTGIEGVVGSQYNDVLDGTSRDDSLEGGRGLDTMWGWDGADYMDGGEQSDDLDGGEGADILYGGGENDALTGGEGGDILAGGDGFDVVFYRDSNVGVEVNLGAGAGDRGSATGDSLFSIESVVGSHFGDALTGDSGDNRLNGAAGNDVLTGGMGADTFVYQLGLPRAPAGDDVVTDFDSQSRDRIDLSSWGADYDTFAEVMSVATQVRNDVVFDFGAHGSLTLQNVYLEDFSALDFILPPRGHEGRLLPGNRTFEMHGALDADDRFETFLLPSLDRLGDGADLF